MTCARPPNISGTELAKVAVSAATPTAGVNALHTRTGTIVEKLDASLIEHERNASTRS